MELFRNKEIRLQLIISAAVCVVLGAAGWILKGAAAGVLVFMCGAAVSAVSLFFLSRRYSSLSALSRSIDRILHGQESLLISGSEEGELAILSSEIQKMTVMLRDQTDQLKAEKLRLTDAIADMFHQMRTPLTSMNIQLSLLESEDLSYEKRVLLARELKKQTERLHWLVETLLKMSRIDAGVVEFKKDRVSVKTLVSKAAEPFLIPMELRGQELIIDVSDESFTGDLAWSVEAIGNLIKNCMEHTPEGGWVRVEALETAIFTQITVQDSGSGFDPADIPYLFERFYKGSNASQTSIGIGLALSRAIITEQGGTIAAENAPDGGARFIVKFYKSVV